MIVSVIVRQLLELVGRKLSYEEIEESLFLLKSETERVDEETIAVEVNPDRQDLLSTEGIARALRAFLGISPGPVEYRVRKSGCKIIVSKGLEKIRPYIACGIAKGVQVSDELIKEHMHLQELLTDTHGRNRRKASIGLYVLDDISFPIHYHLEKPESIHFVPLGHEVEMDGPTILQQHEKGILYGPIIAQFKKWPLLSDSSGHILSLPPIINSRDLGRITERTSNIFVEVTGTHFPTVNQALNITIASLAERGAKLESVTVIYPDGSRKETPDLKPSRMTISTADATKLIGIDLSDEEAVQCLRRMCYGARAVRPGRISVDTPPYRTDIMHEVDVFEDIAIGYRFDRIEPTFPGTMTVGRLLPSTRLESKVRDLMVGVEYQEVVSYVMTSPENLTTRVARTMPMVSTGNPKSKEFSVLRNSILPILLDFASRNQHADYPQRLFELGEIVLPEEKSETRSRQVPALCGLVADSRVNLTDMMSQLAFMLRGVGLEGRFSFASRADATFIEGRSGSILVDGAPIGCFGEVSPAVLANFALGRPVVAFELELPRTGSWDRSEMSLPSGVTAQKTYKKSTAHKE